MPQRFYSTSRVECGVSTDYDGGCELLLISDKTLLQAATCYSPRLAADFFDDNYLLYSNVRVKRKTVLFCRSLLTITWFTHWLLLFSTFYDRQLQLQSEEALRQIRSENKLFFLSSSSSSSLSSSSSSSSSPSSSSSSSSSSLFSFNHTLKISPQNEGLFVNKNASRERNQVYSFDSLGVSVKTCQLKNYL